MNKINKIACQSTFWIFLLSAPASAVSLQLSPIGSYSSGIFDQAASIISTYDSTSYSLFTVDRSNKSVNIINISDPTNPFLANKIDISTYDPSFGNVNSVAFQNGILAVAIENINKELPGSVVFFKPDGTLFNGSLANSVTTVGALPDMLTFTPDGSKILVANEGEPTDDYTIDPEGSISIIDVDRLLGGSSPIAKLVGFQDFNVGGSKHNLLDSNVRIFGPNATVAEDLEPEAIAISEDGKKATVTLQENNGVALLDIETGIIEKIVGLGFKDHSAIGLDGSDRDGKISITTYNNLFGIYNPDEIASFTLGNKNYWVTANEGDARDYDGFSEEERVADLILDPSAFPNASEIQQSSVLGRLRSTNTLGDIDSDGDFDRIYAFGARSFTIWDENAQLVWDSGEDFERIIAKVLPNFFNANNTNNNFDDRSDDKGPEPESIRVARIGGKIYAFIGLERVGGVMVYDISDPQNPTFVTYQNNRDFTADPSLADDSSNPLAGDLGTEGLLFISAKDSPNGKSLLVTSNEISGTTTILEVQPTPEPSLILGILGLTTWGAFSFKRKID
jgi:DNA-binding beta-propeller fold protein YncE